MPPNASSAFAPNLAPNVHGRRPYFERPFATFCPAQDVLPPISRLPVELLNEVFSHLPFLSAYGESFLIAKDPPCVAVSYVCKHWRRVALECKLLWTNIPLKSPSWTAAFLERSRPAGMAVDINASFDPNNHCHESALLALKEVWRTTTLTLSYGPGHDPDRVDEAVALLSAHPTPLLQEFHLQLAHVDDPIPIDPHIFAGSVPKNLRSLMLFGCDLSAGSPLLHAPLTALQIDRNCRIWLTVDDMVETLKGMPNLEEFIADCSHLLLDVSPSTTYAPHCVNLPRLKLLQLADNYPQAIKIFRHLNLPHNTQICLLGSAPVPLPSSSEKTTMAALEHHFSSALASNASFSDLDLVFQTGSFSLAANPTMESSFDVPPSDDHPLPFPVSSRSRFGFSFTVPTFVGYDIPLAVLQMSLFHGTTTLTVKDNDDSFGFGASRADPTLWSRMAAYKEVETLEVTGRWAYSLVDALNRYSKCDSLVLFPRLRELVIEEVQFDNSEKDPEGRASFFARLMTGLDGHIASGTLKMLAIAKCDVERRMVDALRVRLGEYGIDWDGRVRGKGTVRRTMVHACRIGGIATPAQL